MSTEPSLAPVRVPGIGTASALFSGGVAILLKPRGRHLLRYGLRCAFGDLQ
jgi:hypothetical protein